MTSITLTRINYAPTYTLGFIKHGDFFCFTLEPGKSVGKGCIPCGVYPIVWEWSPKFNRMLYELKNVPGKTEVKFHEGCYITNTTACILLGLGCNLPHPESTREQVEKFLILSGSQKAVTRFNDLCHEQKITEIMVRDV